MRSPLVLPHRGSPRASGYVRLGQMALCLSSLVGGVACSAGEVVEPAPVASATQDPPKPSGPGPTGVPPRRTVALRSPLGGPANNLLADGDFELSAAPGGGQYGWRMFNTAGTAEVAMTVETGGLCRSGLTCVRFEKGQLLFGRGAAAPGGKGHVVSMYAKLPEGAACKKIDVLAVDCDTFSVLGKTKADPEPDAGWCRHTTTFGPAKGAVCLYVQNTLAGGEVALLDAAVLAPNDGTVPLQSLPAGEPVDAATEARMAALAATLRRTRLFGRPPVTAPPPLR